MSNGKLTNRLALTTDERPCHSNVYPSGGELTTVCTAMLVEAPGRFSMMTGCPSRLDSHGSMIRATVSAPPPAGKPMIQRSDFDGYACARAMREIAGTVRPPAASCRNRRRRSFMVSSQRFRVELMLLDAIRGKAP